MAAEIRYNTSAAEIRYNTSVAIGRSSGFFSTSMGQIGNEIPTKSEDNSKEKKRSLLAWIETAFSNRRFTFAQLLATGLDMSKVKSLSANEARQILDDTKIKGVEDCYPIVSVSAGNVQRSKKVVGAERRRAEAIYGIWKLRSHFVIGITALLWSLFDEAEFLLPELTKTLKFSQESKLMRSNVSTLISNNSRYAFYSLEVLETLKRSACNYYVTTEGKSRKEAGKYSDTYRRLEQRIKERTSSLKILKRNMKNPPTAERPLPKNDSLNEAERVMLGEKKLDTQVVKLENNCMISSIATFYNLHGLHLSRTKLCFLECLGVKAEVFMEELLQYGVSRLMNNDIVLLLSKENMLCTYLKESLSLTNNGTLVSNKLTAKEELKRKLISKLMNNSYDSRFGLYGQWSVAELNNVLNSIVGYPIVEGIKLENMLRTNKYVSYLFTNEGQARFVSSPNADFRVEPHQIQNWLERKVALKLADKVTASKLDVNIGYVTFPSYYMTGFNREGYSYSTNKDMNDKRFEQVIAFRVALGHVVYMNRKERYVIFGPELSYHSFNNYTKMPEVLRIFGGSALGFKKNEIKGWAIHQGVTERRISTLVIPDEDWDLLVGAFERGVIFYPQVIEMFKLCGYCMPAKNYTMHNPCFGELCQRQGQKYRAAYKNIQPAVAAGRTHASFNNDVPEVGFGGFHFPPNYIKELAEKTTPCLKTKEARTRIDLIMTRIINQVGCVCYSENSKTPYTVQKALYNRQKDGWSWKKLRNATKPSGKPFDKSILYVWFALQQRKFVSNSIYGGNVRFTSTGGIWPNRQVTNFEFWYNAYQGKYGIDLDNSLKHKRSSSDGEWSGERRIEANNIDIEKLAKWNRMD